MNHHKKLFLNKCINKPPNNFAVARIKSNKVSTTLSHMTVRSSWFSVSEKANEDKDIYLYDGVPISGVDLKHLHPITSHHILTWWILLNHLPIFIHKIHVLLSSTSILKLYNCFISQSLSFYSNSTSREDKMEHFS